MLVIFIIIVFNIIFYISGKEILYRDIEKREQAIADNFFTVCQDAVIRNDDILILNYIKGIKRTQPGVRYAYLMEPSGLILTLYNSSLFPVPARTVFEKLAVSAESGKRLWKDGQDNQIVELSKLMYVREQIVGISIIGFSNTYYEKIFTENQRSLRRRMIGISILMLALGFGGSFFLAHKMVEPIKNIIRGVKEIGAGNLDQKVEPGDKSELGELARAVNRMGSNLKELDDMKRHFIASVSHELRSPLNAIEGHVDFIIEELYTKYDRDRVIDILNTIKKNSTRLSGFINNILDLSKMESGKLDLDLEALNIVNFAEEAVELYSPLAQEKSIHLENKIPIRKALKVNVDRSRMRQVFNNLVGNAIKFTPFGGKVSIDAKFLGSAVEVTVADSGIGIPHEQQKQIFDKFMQIRPNREDVGNVKGTGLGLTIVKGIIEAHGGSISIESHPGKGSSFIFTLPVHRGRKKV